MEPTHTIEVTFLGGKKIQFAAGHVAQQADGACWVQGGDTVVLATACFKPADTLLPFLPLTVDYREYTFAAGRIPGGWFKREGRPTEKEILTCRLIDRPLRPFFPDWYRHETQIIGMVFSADGENDPDILALNGAAMATALSSLPLEKSLAGVRVGRVQDQWVINPTKEERDQSILDIVVAGTEDAVVMVEAGALEVPEDILLEAIEVAFQEIQKIIHAIDKLKGEIGKPKLTPDQDYGAFLASYMEKLEKAISRELEDALLKPKKEERKEAVEALKTKVLESLAPEEEDLLWVEAAFEGLEKKLTRSLLREKGLRLDGRRPEELRDIRCQVQVMPRTHGSALFTRGETQALATVTLGTQQDAQIIEDFFGDSMQRFMLHYNFPPFSTGEVKFLRSPSRREIGHGALARRALIGMIPKDEMEFPYTVRVVSNILSSNGSSSMATVCSGSLALMDAGVPMKKAVAGVAMGLMKEGDWTAILTDIAGHEDHFGDMDFKVAGTRDGVTALQMDIKIPGLSRELLAQALQQARTARLQILDAMDATLAKPRKSLSPHAPRIFSIVIPKEKIGDVIGTGGRTIRSIIEATGCRIEINDDGTVYIASKDEASAEEAKQLIQKYSEVPQVGKIYQGTVRRVESYGAFVEILPGTDGLLHVSEYSTFRVENMKDFLKEGDEVKVQIIAIEEGTGKIKLSRKVLLKEPEEPPKGYNKGYSRHDRDRGRNKHRKPSTRRNRSR